MPLPKIFYGQFDFGNKFNDQNKLMSESLKNKLLCLQGVEYVYKRTFSKVNDGDPKFSHSRTSINFELLILTIMMKVFLKNNGTLKELNYLH